jgi:acyl dehydratase
VPSSPAERNTISLNEIPNLAGTSFAGPTMTVTERERETFEHVTMVDLAYPQPDAPEFPSRIVEGFHTLALLDAMATLVRPFDPATTYAYNYGLDRVRWVAPVMIGDELHSHFECTEVTERGEGWLIRKHVTVSVVGAEKPAMLADWLVYVRPRTDAATDL